MRKMERLTFGRNGNQPSEYMRQYMPRFCGSCGNRMLAGKTVGRLTSYYCHNENCDTFGDGLKIPRPQLGDIS